MLLKFPGMKRQYAIGLRWAVDDRNGIEAIQLSTNLNYGVMFDTKEKLSGKLKLVALADASHNKAICLAGLLASCYKDLILVHRISDTVFWLCVIKNYAVWSGVDVAKATAGDFIGGYTLVNEIIEIAKTEFSAADIDLPGVLLSTDTASEEFPECQSINFISLITQLKKAERYVIHYLQPSRILRRKILSIILIFIVFGIVVYYVQQQRLVTRLLYQQQLQQEAQRKLEIKQKIDYFNLVNKNIREKVGYAVINNVLKILNFIPLQSQGWDLTSANYNTQMPQNMALTLTRSNYGTLDSFLYAYSKTPMNGVIQQDNNSGTKTLSFNDLSLESGPEKIPEAHLMQSIPRESYRLISYMQLNKEMFNFQLKEKSKNSYGVNSTTFEISGGKLWQLKQLQKALMSFPTLVIADVNFFVSDYDMSWKLKGEIYA